MTESLTKSRQEGDTGIIKLRATPGDGATPAEGDDVCDEPEIVKLMVEYFYHFDYLRDTESLPKSSQSSTPIAKSLSHGYIIEHAKVFAIAVKYQIDGLRDLAASKYKEAATTCWNHEEFAHSVFVAFNSTAEEVTQLRDIVSDTLHQHFDDLKDKAEVETVICNIPRLAYALLERRRARGENGSTGIGEQSGSPVLPENNECTTCGTQFMKFPYRWMWSGRKYCPRCE